MVRLLLWASVLAIGTSCLGETSEPGREGAAAMCERAREHVIELQLGDAMSGSPDREAHRHALRASLGDGWLSDCVGQLADTDHPDAVACALAATDAATLAACATAP